jgi:hypothetical protein
MQVARAVRLLPFPTAIGLGTALAVACSSGGPTAPDDAQAGPLFAATKGPVDDYSVFKTKQCSGAYSPLSVPVGTQGDANDNGIVCVKSTGPGPKK